MQDIDLAFPRMRDRLELFESLKFAFVRLVAVERAAINDFYRVIFAQNTAGQPDFAVAAPTNTPDQVVIRDWRWRMADMCIWGARKRRCKTGNLRCAH